MDHLPCVSQHCFAACDDVEQELIMRFSSLCYSIWGAADGAWVIDVDSEAIAYAILDVLAKPIFGLWLLTTHDRMARTSPTLDGFWAHGIPTEGALRV